MLIYCIGRLLKCLLSVIFSIILDGILIHFCCYPSDLQLPFWLCGFLLSRNLSVIINRSCLLFIRDITIFKVAAVNCVKFFVPPVEGF